MQNWIWLALLGHLRTSDSKQLQVGEEVSTTN